MAFTRTPVRVPVSEPAPAIWANWKPVALKFVKEMTTSAEARDEAADEAMATARPPSSEHFMMGLQDRNGMGPLAGSEQG
jgi:hypothetical protein